MKTHRRSLASLLLIALSQTLPAASLTWDGDPATPGLQVGAAPREWNSSNTKWWDGAANVSWNSATPDSATFDLGVALAGNAIITLTEPVTVAALTFNPRSTSNQFQIDGSPLLTFAENATVKVDGTNIIWCPISGGFSKTSGGRLIIGNDNTAYSGIINFPSDRLQIGNNGSVGGLGTGSVVLGNESAAAQLIYRRRFAFNVLNSASGNGRAQFELNTDSSVTLNPASPWSYNGTTTLIPAASGNKGGKVSLGNHNRLPSTTVLTFGINGTSQVTFDLNGFNQTVAGLVSGTGVTGADLASAHAIVTNSKTTSSTLTVSGNADSTYAGIITGNLNLAKNGDGVMTLTGANSYTGATIVNAGTLLLNAANLSDTAPVMLAEGALLELNFTGTDNVGGLVINGNPLPAGTYDANHPEYGSYFFGDGVLNVAAAPAYQNLRWDSDPAAEGIQAANGTRNTSNTNWWNSYINTSWSNQGPDRATFSAVSPLTSHVTITLGEDISAGGLSFQPGQGTWVFALAGTNTLTLVDTPAVEVIGGTARIDCPISGSFTKTGNNRLVIGSDNPTYTGTVTNTTERLQIGNGGTTGSLGTADIVNNGEVILRRTGVFSFENAISGTGNFKMELYGSNSPVTLNPVQGMTYAGPTIIQPSSSNQAGGVVLLGNHDRFPTTSSLTMNRNGELSRVTLDLNGFNQQFAAIATGANVTVDNVVITNGSQTTSALTVSGGTDNTFAGLLSGNLALVKSGAGRLVLPENNTYSGDTTINGGTLSLGYPCLADGAGVTIAQGAVLELDYTGTDQVAALIVGGASLPVGEYDSSHPEYGSFFGGSGSIAVTGAVQDDFSTWAGGFAGFTETASTSDPDNDSLTNFEEYAFGLDPTSGASANPISAGLNVSGSFSYTRRDPSLSNLSYKVLTSTNLTDWSVDAGAVQTPGATDGNGVQTVTVNLSATPVNGKLFVRVSAE